MEHIFDNYFLHVYHFFKQYTNNINEFIYLFRFLYPKYTLKWYQSIDAGKESADEIIKFITKHPKDDEEKAE